ncbi:hypothetical protein BaRGS_00004587 [Batillaria attramentaria]|uniref:AAA+ ATPase domain-containing protein n=1 Tax=Batillaria attramentaria TaxID=370345 RepID=A0ABD0LYT7_9CAEN
MEKKTKLREPGTCRIFFSSPFGGMEEEREELTRKYFPQIQHACNMHGVQFVAVDMRWGITSQAADDAQVINICLREVDRSDIFVGFFGQRYGWHGADDDLLQKNFDNAVGRYPWLDNVRDKSVTELEFLHGHLNNPGALPAAICFRDKAYDDAVREEGVAKGDKKTVFKYSAESDHSSALMHDLKKRVEATEDRCLGVNMAYSHPHEGARFMFESIWGYLNELLASQSDTKLTQRQQDQAEHDAFRARHTAVYRGGKQYLGFLKAYLSKDSGGCVLVTGPAGCGKSALLSNWTTQFDSTWSDVLLIYHFVGCAPRTTAPRDILQRLLTEMNHRLGKDEGDDDKKKKDENQDVETLQQLLLAALEEAVSSRHKRVVIVLDGLDRSLKSGKTSKHLYWLPEKFPAGVLFVASSTDSDTDTHELLVKTRGHDLLTIHPLDEATQTGDLCGEWCSQWDVLKKSGKELSVEQLQRVVASPQTENPLFLRSVLAELSIFEEDYNIKERPDNLVQEVLCAIALSHNGLLERELMEIFEVPSHEWMPLYFAMEGLLVSHAGLLRFGFNEISEAVQDKYLHSEEIRNGVLQKLIKYFSDQLKSLCAWDDLMTPLSKRPVEELPWEQEYEFLELWKATGWKMPEISRAYEESLDLIVTDLYLHKQETCSGPTEPPGLQIRPLLQRLKDFFSMAGYPLGQIEALKRDANILENAEGIVEDSEREVLLLDARYYLACAYVENTDLEAGEKLHTQVMKACRRVLENTPEDQRYIQTLGYSCNGLGVICLRQRRYDEATEFFQESVRLHRQLGNEQCVADSLTNLGVVHIESNQPEEALKYSLQALQMCEKLYFGHLPLTIGNLLTNIALCHRRLGQLDEAEAMYNRSLEVKAAAVGWDHDVVAMAYMNLGTLNMYRSDYATAEQFMRKALAILEGNGATLAKPEFRQTTENLLAFDALKKHNAIDGCIPSVQRHMVKYLIHTGDTDKAREVTEALIKSSRARDPVNFIHLDHLQSLLPENERPVLEPELTVDHALSIWPGQPDLTRRKIEFHALPAGDLNTILKLLEEMGVNNPDFEASTYEAGGDWCESNQRSDLAIEVMEAGGLRVKLLETYRQLQQKVKAYPHLPVILAAKGDDPAAVLVAGDVAVHAGDYKLALECFEKVSTMDNPELAEMASNAVETLKAQAESDTQEGETRSNTGTSS